LSQDLVGEAARQVTLDLLQFLVKRKAFGRSFIGECEVMAALSTEFKLRWV
jgi:glutamine amidotransferase PdxT